MSLISKEHLSLTLQSVKKIFNKELKDTVRDSTADWNQNDSTAYNYVKNRPFYESSPPITWDGNINGLGNALFGEYYKVSDLTPSPDSLEAAERTMYIYGSDNVATLGPPITDANGKILIFGSSVVVVYSPCEVNDVIYDAGLYFINTEQGNVYTKSLNFADNKLKQIDEKYIPDSFIRVYDTRNFATILTETSFSFTTGPYIRLRSGHTSHFTLTAGVNYEVIFDGVIYPCTAVACSNGNGACIGNRSLRIYDEYNSGEPFYILWEDYYDGNITDLYSATTGEHTIAINETISGELKQIDEKFIPSNITRAVSRFGVIDDDVNKNKEEIANLERDLNILESGLNSLENNLAEAENDIARTMTYKDNVILPFINSSYLTAYGNGTYVAVSPNGKAAYSRDGVNWNSATLPYSSEGYYLHCIAYGNGTFVVLGRGSGSLSARKALYSVDGMNWHAATLPAGTAMYSGIVYSNGKFFAVSEFDSYVIYSTDGISWSHNGKGRTGFSIAYGADTFVSFHLTSNGCLISHSTDGLNWIANTTLSFHPDSLIYEGGIFLLTSSSGISSAHSTDGINWTVVSSFVSCEHIAYGDGKFIITSGSNVYCTTDGVSVEPIVMPFESNWAGVIYGDGKFLFLSSDSAVGAYSVDLVHWGYISQNSKNITEHIKGLVNNIVEREPSADGADGGYYTPVVTQPDDNTLQFDFTPSDPEMPSVTPVQVTLPSQDSGGNADYVGVEPAENDIPKVFLSGDEFGDMTTEKNEVNMELDYISKTDRFHAYIKIKYQGSSSLQHPKKNFTIKMYSDEARDTKLKKAFKTWGTKSHKYVLKANYIDHTHARNVVTARLWGDIVKSRSDYDSLPELLRTSPNQGAVDGFPVKIYVNGVYQGVYTWNIPKDGWMNNMDEDLDTHCMLCGEMNSTTSGSNPCMFRSVSVAGWTDELHDTMPDIIKTSWQNVISFVMNSTNEEFVSGLENYMDVQSVIDFCILARISRAVDSLGKNQMFFTYDGTKWLESVYDLDSTWGSNAYGKLDAGGETTEFQNGYINVTEGGYTNLLYERVENLFMERFKTRYAELRSGALSVANIIDRFERFTDIIGNDLYDEDADIFNIPSATTNNIQQLRDFTVKRLAYMDGVVEAMTVPVLATGISLDKSTATIQGADTLTLVATVTPEDCTESVSWESSNNGIATVKDGVVTAVANGSCTITARVGSYSASCSVTVENIVTKYSMTRTLVGCISTSELGVVNAGESHVETISAIDGFTLTGATVAITMGGADITATVYSDGIITIVEVTGDIVISVSAVAALDNTGLVYSLPETTTFTSETEVDTGFIADENTSFSVLFTLDDYEVPSAAVAICHAQNNKGFLKFEATEMKVHTFAWSPAIPFNDSSNSDGLMSTGGVRKCLWMYDATTGKVSCKMAKNGVDYSSASWGSQSVTFSAWTSSLKIGGAYNTDTPGFDGTISDFRIYERALTEGEINAYLGI